MPYAQPRGVIKQMMLSDAGPSLEAMFALERQKEWRKEWRVSHALTLLAEPALAGFGEKHQTKISSL